VGWVTYENGSGLAAIGKERESDVLMISRRVADFGTCRHSGKLKLERYEKAWQEGIKKCLGKANSGNKVT
jgi:hypothetical protein